ncbi:MAG: hypothetical protein ACK56W_06245 [Pirellula sp.]|jgi:hypothetical protein
MKLDLAKEKERIKKYIVRRIRDYPKYVNLGPGNDEDPIQAVYLGFYAAQGGYIYLVFDTRPGFNLDGEWNNYIDEPTMFHLPKWSEFHDAVYEEERCTLIKADGIKITIQLNSDEEEEDEDAEDEEEDEDEDEDEEDFEDELSQYFGNMLTSLMLELRDDGSLSSLPLTKDAFMIIEEFDGHYFWPLPESCRVSGRILPT